MDIWNWENEKMNRKIWHLMGRFINGQRTNGLSRSEKIIIRAQENQPVSLSISPLLWISERRKKKEKRRSEMASTAAVPFWRAAGMTYITYSNICANLVRNCLKEPFKAEALNREKVHFSLSKWAGGKPEKPSKLLFFLWKSCLYRSDLLLLSWMFKLLLTFVFVLVVVMDLIMFRTFQLLNFLISQVISNTREHKLDYSVWYLLCSCSNLFWDS